jgi:predicted nucleic acid-binding protein
VIVVDSSAVVLALLDESAAGGAARARLSGDADLHAPHLVDLEVISVLRRLAKRREIPTPRAEAVLEDVADLAITRYPHWRLRARIWDLRHNLSPYDAAYVALAEGLGCSLLTADQRLVKAPGIDCDVETLVG